MTRKNSKPEVSGDRPISSVGRVTVEIESDLRDAIRWFVNQIDEPEVSP